MNKDIVKKYIAMPLAIKVFKLDLQKFKEFKMGNLYQDLLETIIDRLQNDFNNLKSELNNTHQLVIKRIDNAHGIEQYKVNNTTLSFTSEELKKMTEIVMNEYLSGDKIIQIERKERIVDYNNQKR